MDTREKLTFRIDSFTPETLPMARLASYLAELAALYGSEERVHFDKLKKGSAIVQVFVEEPAFAKVYSRLQSVKTGDPDPEAQKAYKALDTLLRSDNAVGSISRERGGKVLDFPGRKAPVVETYVVMQPTTVDGTVIKIGGRDDTIPVTLRDQEGKIINCQIRGAANAKALSHHYLEAPIRVHGVGKWCRDAAGTWEIDTLHIQSWEELDTTPLDEIVQTIFVQPKGGWKSVDDPIATWRKLRGLE
ncbi:hypothetical protein [Herbaspirillum aquaticum]|uniref:Uncharacterized protein n=1 Tax=Herbaspirillum aquaticum TaxID=568783 RepID=A0A225SVW8_9BURK|nr:hypothetical protein [Herbaspirillum aquaticum]OWY33702.1 hypothetical protein CEJ45_15130 [Herbaspirillum aquaticum]